MSKKVCIGAVQAEPVWWNLQGSVKKTIQLIHEAGEKGVQVLGFPEVWLCGYPWPIWTTAPVEVAPFVANYMANSMQRDSSEMNSIRQACREAGVFVILGYSERYGGSIYIAQAFIDNQGEIVHNRRKIKPTHVERSVWGDGQADSLKVVVDTPYGKVGGLNCWENLQPLLRYNEYSQGVQIHVAGWPPFPAHPRDVTFPMPYHSTAEANYRISQFVAMEGQTFVICSTQIIKEENHEKAGIKGKGLLNGSGGGFAMIFGPDGLPLVKSLPPGEEGILTTEVDLADIDFAKNMCDPVGQYSRPDLLSLNVTKEAALHVRSI